MASAFITTRYTRAGEKRYVVRYRLGGRAYPILHGGSFRTMKEARARRDFVAGELAAGRDPHVALKALLEPQQRRLLADLVEAYVDSRIDVGDRRRVTIRTHLRRLGKLGQLDPAEVTVADVQAWIVANSDLSPGSLHGYLADVRGLIDYAGIEPNPARSRRLRIPKLVTVEPEPPTDKHFVAFLAEVPRRLRLPLVLMEQTAAPVGEVCAWEWRDVDVHGCRIRSRRAVVKGAIAARARWVQVPAWLMAIVDESCAPDDRTPERRLFNASERGLQNAMRKACKTAKVPQFTPHDLRHRRISLWHGQGVPHRQLAERAGHSRATMSLSVYAHVMPLDEADPKRLRELLVG